MQIDRKNKNRKRRKKVIVKAHPEGLLLDAVTINNEQPKCYGLDGRCSRAPVASVSDDPPPPPPRVVTTLIP